MEIQWVLVWLGPESTLLPGDFSSSRCFLLLYEPVLTFPPQLLQRLHKPSVHTTCPQHSHIILTLCGSMTQQVSRQWPEVAEGAFKKMQVFFFVFFCLHDYAGNKGLRVTGYDNGKCEAWHEVRKTGLLSTIATIRLWPTKTKNTPLGGCWNNQTSLFIHTAKRHNTPAARDVISEWNYGH